MNAWPPKKISANTVPISVGASESNIVVSSRFPITAGGSKALVIAAKVSGVTVGTGITLKLRSSIGDQTAEDSKTAAVTGNGMAYIKLLAEAAGDQAFLPLLSIGQVVISTGTGSAVVVEDVWAIQEE